MLCNKKSTERQCVNLSAKLEASVFAAVIDPHRKLLQENCISDSRGILKVYITNSSDIL